MSNHQSTILKKECLWCIELIEGLVTFTDIMESLRILGLRLLSWRLQSHGSCNRHSSRSDTSSYSRDDFTNVGVQWSNDSHLEFNSIWYTVVANDNVCFPRTHWCRLFYQSFSELLYVLDVDPTPSILCTSSSNAVLALRCLHDPITLRPRRQISRCEILVPSAIMFISQLT